MRVDAHQHFWQLARGDYGWLTPELTPIYRDFMPPDLAPLLRAAGIDGTIIVQAAPTVAETEFMLAIADNTDFVLGVVGWVNFEGLSCADDIARLAQHDQLVGLRPMIQDIEDPDWMLQDTLSPAFAALQSKDLTFDALVLPHHLKNLSTLLGSHPDMRVVIDHGAKPEIHAGRFSDWATDMERLARDTDAYCKISGLVTEAGPDWLIDDLRRYTDHLIEIFGPDRLIWGSDWPVCTRASSYAHWFETTEMLLQGLAPEERANVLGSNALRAYKLAV